ncbi:hypothetical protein RJ639_006582, partial [Escallonia herrerae]
MRGDGILGIEDAAEATKTAGGTASARRKWLKRREKWLVVLGVVLHAVYMLSIFDIYFKTPIVHGMDPVHPRLAAPAKRLVLLVADGLWADKFYEPDAEGNYRAPFLRGVIKGQGRWGVSHARPPTESRRPGHVAIIAGFYEDPSADGKQIQWSLILCLIKADTFSFGSPDIVPIFCGALPHSTWNTYPHEFEDFATDASFLDEWSFDQFQNILNRSSEDPKVRQLLVQDKNVIFLHLLGCDSNGHAHRPFLSIYLNNVKVVDRIAKNVYDLVESYFKDNRTAYIFTADHGMSDKGSHGDGHPSNTDTPLVAWGAGVRHPMSISSNSHSDHGVRFVDKHRHDMPTPTEWGLDGIERVDVNQADIAPLMSTLLGLPCPVHSVGICLLVTPISAEEVEAVLANAKQILSQFLRKSCILSNTNSNSFGFKPFRPLTHYSSVLDQIEYLVSVRDYEAAMKLSQYLRSLALDGLHYFQTYDWFMLMTVITLGYIGWMIHLVLHVNLFGCFFMGIVCIILFLEHSPPLYHAYTAVTVFLWTQIFNEYRFLKTLWRYLRGRESYYIFKLVATCAVSVFILEFLVNSFTERKLYTWCFLIAGITASVYLYYSVPWKSRIPIFVWLACWFLSIFTLKPAEIPDNTLLVISSGVMIIMIGGVARYIELHMEENKYWLSLLNREAQPRISFLLYLQAVLVGLSSIMVLVSTSHRTQKQELLVFHQLMNWSISGFSMVLPLFPATGLLSRLTSIFLGFAPTFLLLSIGYEAVFYGALGLALMAWILFENSLLYASKANVPTTPGKSLEDNFILEHDSRCLQLSDMRIPLMVFFNVAFFGTGNFASIASFEISSVYRFITIFSMCIQCNNKTRCIPGQLLRNIAAD